MIEISDDKKVSRTKEQSLLLEAQRRLKIAIEEDKYNRDMAMADLEFVGLEGAQWPEAIRAMREGEDRPCLTVNKLPTYVDQIVGDQRMNRPAIKAYPVDSQADPKTATIIGGWIKHVYSFSKADNAIDHGFEHAGICGYGACRVITRYVSDNSFEQEALIQKIDNALAVYWGKHSEYDCSDAMYCFIISDIPREEYKAGYGFEPMPFNVTDARYVEGWSTKDTVRVAEYFVKEPKKWMLYQLNDGRIVSELGEGDRELVERKREVVSYDVKWYLISGDRVLKQSTWLGKKYIPVIPIWGKEINVGGKRVIRGLIRNAKDSQRMYNYWNSIDTEMIALQPKVPYFVTPKQIEGHEGQWTQAHKKSFPYLLVNPDPKAPGWPKRESPPQASSAFISKLNQTDQEIRDTIGLQKASLGMQSNERSGAAIRERKQEGDVGVFAFIDNLSRSLQHLGRVLLDIAPALLDGPRIIRLGLESGDFEFAEINQDTGETDAYGAPIIANNLSVGTYDISIAVGPSFTTQRSEARQSMGEFIQYVPDAAPYIIDLYARAMDWPESEKVAERLELLLPPEVRAEMAAEKAEGEGASATPPEGAPLPPEPTEPSPEEMMAQQMAEMQAEEERLKLEITRMRFEQEKVKLAKQLLELDKLSAEVQETVGSSADEIIQGRVGEGEAEKPPAPDQQLPAEIPGGVPEELAGAEEAGLPEGGLPPMGVEEGMEPPEGAGTEPGGLALPDFMTDLAERREV